MKTTVIANAKENGTVKNILTDKSAIRPAITPKENANATNEDKPKEPETVNASSVKFDVKSNEVVKETVAATEAPKAEPTKTELREALQEQKLSFNLETTIKLAQELNRRINQRAKLLETIGTLEEFEVAQKDDAEETDNTNFQRCELTIEDDKGRDFTTKNPFIINAVAKMVNTLCVDKLAEIEGEIYIPVK